MPTREFLDWSHPLPDLLADRLLPAVGKGPLDLGHCLILAPTRQSGRRLREHLARTWRERGGTALLSLEVRPPSFLMQPGPDLPVAHLFDVLAAWRDLLAEADPAELPRLLPERGERLGPAAALDFARPLQSLREELLDGGLDLTAVADLHPLASEQQRWRELARLEQLYRDRLHALGLLDPCDAKRAAAAAFRPRPAVRTLLLAAVPDPSPLVLRRLHELDVTLDIRVLVHAPPSEAAAFDEWGRPLEAWASRCVGPSPEPPGWIELIADPPALERRLADLFASSPAFPDLAFGLLDDPLAPVARAALQASGKRLYHPKPRRLSDSPAVGLLHALHQARTSEGPVPLRALWRHPDLLSALSPQPSELLRAWDEYAAVHLPQTPSAVDETLPPGPLREAWERLRTWIAAETPLGLLAVLRAVYARRTLDPALPEERFALREMNALADLLQEASRRERDGRPPSLPLLLEALRQVRVDPPRVEGDVTAEGWLELPHHQAPSLLLIGLHEGVVPASKPADPFLPDGLRAHLRLRSDRDWRARDAYLLHSLIQSRAPGAVRVLVLKRDGEGNPQRPSRLLFACDDDTLLARAALLFREPPPPPPAPPPAPGLLLRPHLAPHRPLDSLSVSSIGDYLRCPTRFFLRHVLGMRTVDDLAREPDPAAFGTLLHSVLRDLMRGGPVSPPEWDAQAEALLADRIDALYGTQRTLSHRVLQRGALQRLQAAGRLQERLWQEGWTPLHLEIPLTRSCDGLPIHGTLDRIDRHPDLGYRILDYKTSDTATDPAKAHTSAPRPGAEQWQFSLGGKTRQWTSLQLPLYRWLAHTLPGLDPQAPLEVLYFQLPRDSSACALAAWPDEPSLAPAAETCLHEVVRRIREGLWTPATAKLPFDDFAALFHHGPDGIAPA